MSAEQHPERGITMEMNKDKVTMSDMLLTYINYGQKEGIRDMYKAMHTYGLIDTIMWNEWNHLVDLLGRIEIMAGWDSPDFATRAGMLIQVLDEAKSFDVMDEVDRCSHLVKFGIEPFIPV